MGDSRGVGVVPFVADKGEAGGNMRTNGAVRVVRVVRRWREEIRRFDTIGWARVFSMPLFDDANLP